MAALLFLALAILLVPSSCGGDDREEILVFAAASLTDVMSELGQRFAEAEGVKVSFSLGGSASLAQLIIRGAPADVFLSAGHQPVDRLEERGLFAPGTRTNILSNELVAVGATAESARLGISSVEDLATADVRVAIADPDLAPGGNYAREALRNLGLWERLEPRLIFASDVRVALGYVDTGNADVGIVYRTDVRVHEDLEILATIPKDSYPPVVYPGGVVARSPLVDVGARFLQYLRGEEAKKTFREYGFVPWSEAGSR